MTYVGIDPGKSGGYAAIIDGVAETHFWDDLKFIEWCNMPRRSARFPK